MKRSQPLISLLLIVALLMLIWGQAPALTAETSEEETRRLLERSLSLVELDNEIERIALQQQTLQLKLGRAERQLEQQQVFMQKQQDKASQVLRAYYTGNRDFILHALLSVNSFEDILLVADYLQWMVRKDRQALQDYRLAIQVLKQEQQSVHNEREQLAAVKAKLLAQRERVAALQQQLDRDLAGLSDSERIRLLIEEMTAYWNNVGLYEVKRYFSALAEAMQALPEWLQRNNQFVSFKGFEYTIRVPEEELNAFLREQNELFSNFAFVFVDDRIEVNGEREGMSVSIVGHYAVEQEPQNAIRFYVDKLTFNGLVLPAATRQSLEEEFDLGFYPHLITSLLQAKSVATTEGELTVQLSLKLR